MSKGHVLDFLGLTRAVLKDCASYHPNLHAGFERDYIRLVSLYENMGVNLFLIHLPALGKLLDRALGSGRLVAAGEPLTRSINCRTKIPRLFQGLWSRVLSRNGCLKQDIDPNDVFFLRTLLGAFKKYEIECAPEYLFLATKEFYDVEAILPPAPSIWDTDGGSIHHASLGTLCDRDWSYGIQEGLFNTDRPNDASLLALVQRVADRVSGLLGEFLPQEFRFRHGPGAVSDLRGSTGYKYQFPSWAPRLRHIFPPDLFAVANSSVLGDGFDRLDALLPSVEHHSRLIAVPKTAKGPRLIAAEPTCHQWCQQNVRDFLDTRIRATYLGASIDFRRQDLSGEDARVSSHVGDRATLDLSSASDRLSCWLVQRLFRKNYSVLSALIASRTRYIYNDLDKKNPSVHKLRKFASMGSALTFPIQSIAFYMLCLAAGVSLERDNALDGRAYDEGADLREETLARLGSAVRVYGDDLIIPVAWVPRVRYILERLYLRVNVDKSFYSGKFRESCGVDAYDGHDVTPARVRDCYSESKPGSLDSAIQTANNFHMKGLWHAAAWLQATVPLGIRKSVPVVHATSGSFGLVSFVGSAATSRKRWNPHLHRVENMAWCLKGKKRSTRHESFANLLQYFTEAPSPLLEWTSGLVGKPAGVLTRRWVALSQEV